jgi:hypothetical protein
MRHGTQGKGFDLSGNLGHFLEKFLFNQFFREFILKKAVFKFLNQFAHLNHQIFTITYCMPRFFGSFIPNLGDLDSRLEGCRTRVISDLFFESFGR